MGMESWGGWRKDLTGLAVSGGERCSGEGWGQVRVRRVEPKNKARALEWIMPIVRPRLTDYHGILASQAGVDFAIPFLDEDIPLYLDPFLLWRSPSQQDNALHTSIINSFNSALSKAKISMVNRLLERVKALLREDASADFLDLLEEDLVPQNADAALMLGQYKAALLQYRERRAFYDTLSEQWVWKEQ